MYNFHVGSATNFISSYLLITSTLGAHKFEILHIKICEQFSTETIYTQ